MAHVRETIELLTHILNENGCSKLKAEIFRLAKFDKDEAVSSCKANQSIEVHVCNLRTNNMSSVPVA